MISFRIPVGDSRIPFHFSFDAKELQQFLKKRYHVQWAPKADVNDGETLTSTLLSSEDVSIAFVAVWVSRHKDDTKTFLVLLHEISHVERLTPPLYGESECGEETQIRIGDYVRKELFKRLGLKGVKL